MGVLLMMRFGQHEPGLRRDIDTDGCLFMVDLNIACMVGVSSFTVPEVNRLYDYMIPEFMMDGGRVHENRCKILNHVEVIRGGLYILGYRNPVIIYNFRLDGDDYVVNLGTGYPPANYFVAKMKVPGGYHFVQVDSAKRVIYNPGYSEGPIVSFRGFHVEG